MRRNAQGSRIPEFVVEILHRLYRFPVHRIRFMLQGLMQKRPAPVVVGGIWPDVDDVSSNMNASNVVIMATWSRCARSDTLSSSFTDTPTRGTRIRRRRRHRRHRRHHHRRRRRRPLPPGLVAVAVVVVIVAVAGRWLRVAIDHAYLRFHAR